MGSSTMSQRETAAVREHEARAAADVIGAELIWMGFPDAFLFSGRDSRLAFIDLMRQSRPDVVITHFPGDYHPDHRAVAQIMIDVRVLGKIPHIKTRHSVRGGISEIFFMDTIAGIDFAPEVYVDVAETFITKQKMLAKHKSQSAWLKDQYHTSYQELIKLVAQFRGIQSGHKFAEGFRYLRTWPSRSPIDLLP